MSAPATVIDPASRAVYELCVKRNPPRTLIDMMEYRIRREHNFPPTPFDDYDPNGDHDFDTVINSTDPDYDKTAAGETTRNIRRARVSAIISGGVWVENNVNHVESAIMAPELAAGLRMDLNRPFGDGEDNQDGYNNLNGVADDPLESGDPFLDVNGNGKYDDGTIAPVEPFLDVDGNGRYTSPADRLWGAMWPLADGGDATLGERVAFDYTNGHAEPIHVNAYSQAIAGGVRNLESQARQLYARQLYCLMLTLVDENFIAPWDENDPQIMAMIAGRKAAYETALTAAGYPAAGVKAQADFLAKRRLTCRIIAQWAINCADMRDSDVIMTPFEYDENPWDGWGCVDRDGKFIPLDGDPATDENGDVTNNKLSILDWNAIATNGGKKVTKDVAAPESALEQTRGLVWGAERPELLITETLGLHDRRCEDLQGTSSGTGSTSTKTHDDLKSSSSTNHYPDDDLDQSLRPRGSLFLELQNPWSAQGQYPAELYTKLDGTTTTPYKPEFRTGADGVEGVELGRLSNFAADIDANGDNKLTTAPTDASSDIKRSPVFRVIVVEDWPDARNIDELDDQRVDVNGGKAADSPKDYDTMKASVEAWNPSKIGWDWAKAAEPPYRAPDPDLDAVFNVPRTPKQTGMGSSEFTVEYPYVEREFYFTTDNSPYIDTSMTKPPDWNHAADKFKIRIPTRAITLTWQENNQQFSETVRPQKFIAGFGEVGGKTQPEIAPLKPGRYGVIGPAGTEYPNKPRIYTSAIGRVDTSDAGASNTLDSLHWQALLSGSVRRIELRPDADPEKQQLLVAANGGDPNDDVHPDPAGAPGEYDVATHELGRDNELIVDNGVVKNVFDSKPNNDATVDGVPDSRYYKPCIAIPVEGMNVSEPIWGWRPSEWYAAEAEKIKKSATAREYFTFMRDLAKNEGRYSKLAAAAGTFNSYDKPFDRAQELVRTGTTPNYRTIHLQRLANPLLPWNPEPKYADGKPNPDHQPNLPINPYRTIDSSSVNLTAFNGTSIKELDDPADEKKLQKNRPWKSPTDIQVQHYLDNLKSDTKPQVWAFRSLERGNWSRLNMIGTAKTPFEFPAQRSLWAQEPAMITMKDAKNTIFDLLPGRNLSRRVYQEIPAAVMDETDGQNIGKNWVNSVLEHSLGFGNESFGRLYDKVGAQPATANPIRPSTLAPTDAAVGAPAPGNIAVWDFNPMDADSQEPNWKGEAETIVNSTNPWLAWGNRPFVSAGELLNVPAYSASTMLRQFTTVSATTVNPYEGTGIKNLLQPIVAANVVDNATRLAAFKGAFGHLANMHNSSPIPADVVRIAATGYPDITPVAPSTTESVKPYGAPHFHRILEFVHVPSRYVGTDTLLNAETFNDVPGVVDTIGADIANAADPRYRFQPPFNRVSRERDPGRVNLNTLIGRRIPAIGTAPPQIWSEVFDGIMHRVRDANPSDTQVSHVGPAWRDVVLSRRGYLDLTTPIPLKTAVPPLVTSDRTTNNEHPDVANFLLNRNFPTFFANPFRSPDSGDLVPLAGMVQRGVQASWLRSHPYSSYDPSVTPPTLGWGRDNYDDISVARGSVGFPDTKLIDDAREAGVRPPGVDTFNVPYANDELVPSDLSKTPLFAESTAAPFVDGNRNPYMMYEPMSRMGNLVTNRSNVFAIWITVGYFEVEPAPNWNDPDAATRLAIRHDLAEPLTTLTPPRSPPWPCTPRLRRRLHARQRSRQRHGRREACPRVLHRRSHGRSRLQAGRRPERRQMIRLRRRIE